MVWQKCKTWCSHKATEVQGWLKSGAEPHVLARSAGVGFSLGLCPILGVSTALCAGALVVARFINVEMHVAMALLANLLAIPIELVLIVPHMRVGEFVTGSPHMQFHKVHFSDFFKKGGAGAELLLSAWHSILGWLLLLVFEAGLVAVATQPLFAYLKRRFAHYETLTTDEELADTVAHDDMVHSNVHVGALGAPGSLVRANSSDSGRSSPASGPLSARSGQRKKKNSWGGREVETGHPLLGR